MGSTFHSQYLMDSTNSGKEPRNNSFVHNFKYASPKRTISKRKFGNEFTESIQSANPRGNHGLNNFKPIRNIKKQKNPNQIFGQKLPLHRIIETLDKENLQKLINNLVTENPELTSKIIESSPDVTINDALSELKRKLDLILINIPYKVEETSDYSFLRVKPFVDDFFQSLSDYSLHFIPPVENDLTISLSFLKRFLSEIFYKLPKFSAVEFKYFHNLTVEKFNLIFETNLNQFLSEKKQNLLLLINENWIDDFKKINELNGNNFSRIEHFLQDEIDKYYSSGSVILSSNENVDTSENKLSGLESILNFAYQNNPLSNNV